MSEAEEKQHQSQNYAEVRFETKSGDAIMEPLKIFRAIDQTYQVATPILKGYVLVKKPDELTRTMTKTPAIIRLVYDRIGTLHVYHGLADVAGELITLKNSDKPDQVAPVKLQEIPEHQYYVMTDDGLGSQIDDPTHFQPKKPNHKTNLVSLTLDEKEKVDEMETELTIDPNGKLPDLDDLHGLSDEPEKVSSSSEDTIDKHFSSRSEQFDTAENDETAEENRASRSHVEPDLEVPLLHDNPKVSEHASPATLLARALSLICDSMLEVDDPKKIEALTDSSKKLLDAIRTLTLLDGVKEE